MPVQDRDGRRFLEGAISLIADSCRRCHTTFICVEFSFITRRSSGPYYVSCQLPAVLEEVGETTTDE